MEASTTRLPSAEQPEPIVRRFADASVARGLLDVGGFVDHHRGVSGAHAIRGLAGTVGGLHHRRPPVAIVKSQMDISSCASGMLGFSMH